MKMVLYAFIFFLYAIILISCTGQKKSLFIPPVPEINRINQEKKHIEIKNITETKNGTSIENLPAWLLAYINGGIEEVERMNAYYGKYVFIGRNEGVNFSALNIWADNFSPVRDLTMLAAERIERRMISEAVLYPDYEYGVFFETMVKRAYSTVYPNAAKEDTYWIKIKTDNDNLQTGNASDLSEIYNFFILITIDKYSMYATVLSLMADSIHVSNPTGSQRNAVNRLQQYFFEGF